MSSISKREGTSPRRWFDRGPLASLRHEMDELFESFFGESGITPPSAARIPSIDLSETEGAVEVKTDLPGVNSDEVNIEIRDDYLTISGEHSEQTESDDGDNDRKFHRVERHRGSFSRSIRLPCSVNQDTVEAELRNGVLTVTMPKAEAAKSHRIRVKG